MKDEEEHPSHHYCAEELRIEKHSHQHIPWPMDLDIYFGRGGVDCSPLAWESDEFAQVYIQFDVGPEKHQVSVHEDFLSITEVATEVFKKIFKYAEQVKVPVHGHMRAYRVPESLDTFKLFLEYLVRDIPQRPELPALWNLDQKKAGDLREFARKWDMEELEKELVVLLGPYWGW